LGIVWRSLEWKVLVYFMYIRNIWPPFRIYYSTLVQFVVIGYIFPVLVCVTKKIWQPWQWLSLRHCHRQMRRWKDSHIYIMIICLWRSGGVAQWSELQKIKVQIPQWVQDRNVVVICIVCGLLWDIHTYENQ
jgi:hypothetical protein